MGVHWSTRTDQGLETFVGETDRLTLVVIPEYGGKTVSLFDRVLDKEWIDRGQGLTPRRPLHTEAAWSAFDCSGWDELFPTVDPCVYGQEPYADIFIPEHGELWRLTWTAKINARSLMMAALGRILPYRFEKTITLTEDAIGLDYRVVNRSPFPLYGLWLMHPLLQVGAGSILTFTPEVRGIQISHSRGNRLGERGDRHPWPVSSDGRNWRIVGDEWQGHADKYFVQTGEPVVSVSVWDATTGADLAFSWSATDIPYTAVWMNWGGWRGRYHVAIEPTTGYLDRLDEAIADGRSMAIDPYGEARWRVDLKLGPQPPRS